MRYCTHASKMEQHNMGREIFDLILNKEIDK